MGLCRCRKLLRLEAGWGGGTYNRQEADMLVWEPTATFISPPASPVMRELCLRLPNSCDPWDGCWVCWTLCYKRLVWLRVRVVAARGSTAYTNQSALKDKIRRSSVRMQKLDFPNLIPSAISYWLTRKGSVFLFVNHWGISEMDGEGTRCGPSLAVRRMSNGLERRNDVAMDARGIYGEN